MLQPTLAALAADVGHRAGVVTAGQTVGQLQDAVERPDRPVAVLGGPEVERAAVEGRHRLGAAHDCRGWRGTDANIHPSTYIELVQLD